MGNYQISIEGIGQHHNDSLLDANTIANECVIALKAAGHNVVHASIVYGACDILGNAPPPTVENPSIDQRVGEFVEAFRDCYSKSGGGAPSEMLISDYRTSVRKFLERQLAAHGNGDSGPAK